MLSQAAHLRRSFPLFFIPLVPYPARSARHLPLEGKALSVVILFPHMRVFVLTMREKRHSRIAAFPIGEGGPRQRRSGALVNDALETISFALFHTARTLSGSLRSPPSPRGEGFVRRYSFSTYACICSDNARKAILSFRCLPPWGRGTASAVDRVLSQTTRLGRSFPLFFIPLVPYPARSARHLPHAGKALSVVILFLHIYPVFALTIWG